MQDFERIGRNIFKMRKEQGLSQEDLAGIMEIERSYLSEMENGHANFSITVLMKLSDALGTTPDKILLPKS